MVTVWFLMSGFFLSFHKYKYDRSISPDLLADLNRDHTFMTSPQTGDGGCGLEICHVFVDSNVFKQ